MISLSLITPTITGPNYGSPPNSKIYSKAANVSSLALALKFHPLSQLKSPLKGHPPFISVQKPRSYSNFHTDGEEEEEEEEEGLVQEIRVPNEWLNSSKALEESEWLRVTLHKWLDDEYCPEETNVQISKVAANSYYNSLMEKQTDLGDILIKMAIELESISYQESFHGAFTSANAAVNLILQRIVTE